MNRCAILIFITISSLTISCNLRSTDSKSRDVSVDSTFLKCYLYCNDHDTISLTITRQDEVVSGTLTYHLYQKDKNTGVIQGQMEDDLLVADYTFQSEGLQSVRQVVFKKVGDNLIEGYGETENKNARSYFTTIDSLKFNDSIVLKAANCTGY